MISWLCSIMIGHCNVCYQMILPRIHSRVIKCAVSNGTYHVNCISMPTGEQLSTLNNEYTWYFSMCLPSKPPFNHYFDDDEFLDAIYVKDHFELHKCATNVSTQVALYACCHVIMVILMAWRGTVVAPVLMHWSCRSLALCHQSQYASCFIHMLTCYHGHIDGLAWDCGSSSADALELLQSCTVPSESVRKLFYTYVDMLSWSYWWLGVGLW